MQTIEDSICALRSSLNSTLFICVVAFFIFDIASDIYEGEIGVELFIEIGIFLLASVMLFCEMRTNLRSQQQIVDQQTKVTRLSGNLHSHIEDQLLEWKFTKSEKEIAWLLLRGYSFQEIAEVRNTKEKTVRQQATAIYSKSGTKNRNEFVAHFMSDLLASEHLEPAGSAPESI